MHCGVLAPAAGLIAYVLRCNFREASENRMSSAYRLGLWATEI
jgi:hypothetical protein